MPSGSRLPSARYIAVLAASVLIALVLQVHPVSPFGPSSAAAENFLVDTTDDDDPPGPADGDCSLREAIENANDNSQVHADCPAGDPDGDVIQFDSSAFQMTSTITLEEQIEITDDLVIDGSAVAGLSISGDEAVRIFSIQPSNGATTVSINDIILTEGRPTGGGGAIFIATGATVELVGVTVSASRSDEGDGGGILNDGTLILDGGTSVTGNSTLAEDGDGDGGGIYNTGTLTIRGGSSVTGNRTQDVVSGENGNGGGIFNDGGTVAIEAGSQISGNTALEDGGGIYNATGGTVTIAGSTVSNNGGEFGGGIYNEGTLELEAGSTVGPLNTAQSGGGIANVDDGSVALIDSTVHGNSATNSGGGILNNGGLVTLSRSTVGPANAGEGGAGIANEGLGRLALTNSTVSGNVASTVGGGILNEAGEVFLLNSTVAHNAAPDGAGGGVVDLGAITIYLINTIVASNTGGDCLEEFGNIVGVGNNLDSDGSCSAAAGSNVTTGNASLAGLANNGGFTQTHALQEDSEAIDGVESGDGEDCGVTELPEDLPSFVAPLGGVDQRGEPRPRDGNGDGVALCDIGAYEVQPPAATLTVTKLCPNGAGDATFEVQLRDAGGATVASEAIACDDTVVLPDLVPGDYTLTEVLAGPDAGAFATGIACTDGAAPVEGPSIAVTLEDGSAALCVIVNVLEGPGGDDDGGDGGVPDGGLLPFLRFLDLHLDNANLNLVEIDNANRNDNANTNANDNENENTNDNLNDNANTNTQDQTNEQTQRNENEQTNNIDASPEVNIR